MFHAVRSSFQLQDATQTITTIQNENMTRNEFNSLCAMLFIAPEIALENESVRAALRDGAHEDEIAEILESEF